MHTYKATRRILAANKTFQLLNKLRYNIYDHTHTLASGESAFRAESSTIGASALVWYTRRGENKSYGRAEREKITSRLPRLISFSFSPSFLLRPPCRRFFTVYFSARKRSTCKRFVIYRICARYLADAVRILAGLFIARMIIPVFPFVCLYIILCRDEV